MGYCEGCGEETTKIRFGYDRITGEEQYIESHFCKYCVSLPPAEFIRLVNRIHNEETDLYNKNGEPAAHIDEDGNIFSFSGKPLCYIKRDSIYTYDGKHIGFFEDGWVHDHKGDCLFFTEDADGGPSKPSLCSLPSKSSKLSLPSKGSRESSPSHPSKRNCWSESYEELEK